MVRTGVSKRKTYTVSLGDRLEAPDGRGSSDCMDCSLSLSGDDDSTTCTSGGQARSSGDSEHGWWWWWWLRGPSINIA